MRPVTEPNQFAGPSRLLHARIRVFELGSRGFLGKEGMHRVEHAWLPVRRRTLALAHAPSAGRGTEARQKRACQSPVTAMKGAGTAWPGTDGSLGVEHRHPITSLSYLTSTTFPFPLSAYQRPVRSLIRYTINTTHDH